jgi:hypothetical protein
MPLNRRWLGFEMFAGTKPMPPRHPLAAALKREQARGLHRNPNPNHALRSVPEFEKSVAF